MLRSLFFGTVLIVIGFKAFSGTLFKHDDAKPAPTVQRVDPCGDRVSVFTMANLAIRQAGDISLRSPSTAEWSGIRESQTTRLSCVNGVGTWTVSGTVDAMNAFNARIRSNWVVNVTHDAKGHHLKSWDIQ